MPATWHCYTDGACKPGVVGAPGGWGYVLRTAGAPDTEGHGAVVGTEAKGMEVRAIAEALARLPAGASVVVYSDNQPLVQSLVNDLETWRRRDFARVDPAVVEWLRALDGHVVAKALDVRWQWVRGHGGNAGNTRADELAALGAREAKAELARSRPRGRS